MPMNPPVRPQRVEQLEIRTIIPINLPEWRGPEVDVFTDLDDDTWLVGPDAARHASHALDWIMSRDRVTCCSCQGGFDIWVDGESWNHSCVDEWWMTMTWFHGLEHLLGGGSHFEVTGRTALWEQAETVFLRRKERLILWDDAAWDEDDEEASWWPIDVDLRALLEAILAANVDLQAYFDRLEAIVLERADGLGASAAELEALYNAKFSGEDPMTDLDKLASVLEQLHRARYFAETPRIDRYLQVTGS